MMSKNLDVLLGVFESFIEKKKPKVHNKPYKYFE